MAPFDASVDALDVAVYDVPTDYQPEADGTLEWSSTTMVLVTARSGDTTGLGWTYAGPACKPVIEHKLAPAVVGGSALDVGAAWQAMVCAIRNLGRPGIVATAISAVDNALWDLKARLLGVPLSGLLGQVHEAVPIYGSGGFTTYDDHRLRRQLEHWVGEWEIPRVKVKIGQSWGRCTDRDLARVHQTRQVVGADVEVYVDANGGYTRKQAIRVAEAMGEDRVSWFEEPVSSDDLDGLHEVRAHTSCDVAAGEYGYDLVYFERMCAAGAVDCLQVDVTRCGGITDFLRAAAVAAAHGLAVSGHCAPNQHAHVATAIANLRHLEYFHDHVRIESMFFEGTLDPRGGQLRPDRARAGLGLALKAADVEQYRTA